jgi:hypothetical protein
VTKADKYALAAIMLAAFAARLVVAFLLPDQGFPDADGYRVAGQELWGGSTMSSTYIMPLYPLLVGLAGGALGQKLIDMVLSTAAVWLVHQLAFELFRDRVVAMLSALGTAVYPYFIFYAAVGLTEPLFVTLIMVPWQLHCRGDLRGAGDPDPARDRIPGAAARGLFCPGGASPEPARDAAPRRCLWADLHRTDAAVVGAQRGQIWPDRPAESGVGFPALRRQQSDEPKRRRHRRS